MRARSITVFLNCAKLRRPEEPASTTVVTPTRRAKASGKMLVSPPARPTPSEPAKTCACRSIRPGVTYRPDNIHRPCAPVLREYRRATAAIRPSRIATSRTALILFLGSITWAPFKSKVIVGLGEQSSREQD